MSKKLEDWEAYWKKLAADAGLNDEQAKPVLEALKNDKVREGFVMRPDYSRDLDSVRDKTKKEVEVAASEKAQAFYQNWVNKDVQPQLDEAKKATQELLRYKAAYGDLTGSDTHTQTGGNGNYLTKEDLEKAKAELSSATTAMATNILKQGVPIALRHYQDFGEVLNLEELEKFGNEKGFTSAQSAYESFIKPRRDEKLTAEWEEKLKAAREEGFKEGKSRSAQRTAHEREYTNPLFRPKEENKLDPREEFFKGLDGIE